ncbi:hypothetical protein [Tellurirhabdus bombi]|uniref:hypothetical protein n=1 Tax=Tellurirhabdus bombi TaxID=2907205 RepID=UPI001F1F560A|nr:hypothetical protein [Tellurirhabdus bombi]
MSLLNFIRSSTFWELMGWLAFALVGVMFIASDFRRTLARWQQITLLLALVGLVFLNRLLLLLFNLELNPDESQLLSQAITLFHHPIYWKSTDGATMGPLSSYFASVPAYLGFPLDYITLRWSAFFCIATGLVTGYFTLENFFGARTARLALFPAAAFLSFTQHFDFLHATNEQLSLALLGICFWMYSRMWRQQAYDSVPKLFLLSFVASMVPFAKLQGTPIALVIIGITFLGILEQYPGMRPGQFWWAFSSFIVGGLVFPIFVLLMTFKFNVFDDFMHYYFLANFSYSAGGSFWSYLSNFPAFVGRTTDFLFFVLPTFVLFISWAVFSRQGHKRVFLFTLASIMASMYSVVKPGNEFIHYLLYLVFPISLLNACLLDSQRAPVYGVAWVALVFVLTAVCVDSQFDDFERSFASQYRREPLRHRHPPGSLISNEIKKYAKAGEYLVVWGWAPRYNVETQMPQGVCDNHTIRCVLGDPKEQLIHRERYIRNLRTSRPPIFVDAVGPNSVWLQQREEHGYETFPELKDFINKHYQYAGEIQKTRIYVRTDRYLESVRPIAIRTPYVD